MKKQIILGMATLMFAGMLSTSNVSAAGTDKEVTVSYDNRSGVVDPENPSLPYWSVSIPTAIAFADNKKTQAVDVELIALNGAKLTDLADTLTINVKAKSANGMLLKSDSDGLAYTVVYGSASLSDKTEVTIADLQNGVTTANSNKKEGTATLGTDKATKLAAYTDTLTYTITKTAD